jgi:hypothetical protein
MVPLLLQHIQPYSVGNGVVTQVTLIRGSGGDFLTSISIL